MSTCYVCGRSLKRLLTLGFIFSFQPLKEPLICEQCKMTFERIDKKQGCAGCGRQQEHSEYCTDCVKWQSVYPDFSLNHRALFTYNDAARELMLQYKFQGDIKLALIFSEVLKDVLKPYLNTHIITTIPTSQTSYEKRGFHAVDLLLDYAKIKHESLLLVAVETGLQSGKTRKERLNNAQPFCMGSQEKFKEIKKKILIIDDVYTTGRTIFHAREVLEPYATTESLSLFR